jgi:MYXO-CTERM domain-containing protein
VGLVCAWAAATGCAGGDAPAPVARNRVVGRPAELRHIVRPLTAAPDSHPSPDTKLALAPDVTVDARVLVITADGTDAAFDAVTQTLRYLGTPFDVLNASTGPELTTDALVVGGRGRYYAVVLDVGDLVAGKLSAFTDAEWMTLASYEAQFGVRRAAMYAFPSDAYGLTPIGDGFDASTKPVTAHCTPAGATVFVGANCAAPFALDDAWVYAGQPTDAATVPLLVDDAGAVYAATRTYPDGREALVMTFSQSPTSLPSLELAYGVVSWVTRGVFVGERHVYLAPQIDDLFLASAIYSSTDTYRITADDLQAFTNWQSARQADPLTAQFRAAFAFNAFGAKPPGRDGLTDKALALGPTFAWLNHTWDHAEMDAMSYAMAFEELSQNNQYGIGSGLSRYSVENLVTPSMTGLGNAEVMRAAYDVGIRQVISDASVACEDNPSPNAGYYNALVPTLLQIPRRATELYFNVSQPAEWVTEYQVLRPTGPSSIDQIVDKETTEQLRYLMRGETNPWMFHQANLRDLGGGQSLITMFLDGVLAKYAARATFPIVSPTMDELAQKVKARMAFDAAGVSASIGPGGALTVQVAHAATVPITGLCTAGAETYMGQQISYLQMADGQSITLSLADCNVAFMPAPTPADGNLPPGPTVGGNCPPPTGTGGSGGTGGGGADGSAGAGGSDGTGGAGGDTTSGSLSTDASTTPGDAYGGGNGCGCAVSDPARTGGAGAVLLALITAAALLRRRRRPTRQASWAMRPSFSGRSIR